ncbi:hypothetical protein [Tenacibaculum agarivorans]|uniref:hypothetical protein n=1 Tax=Tenacibaculum agarivorans TaxID=1908389 RepID=UPI0009FB11EC|nr:hypothetical protein [Tenacibaculum agarivorans]
MGTNNFGKLPVVVKEVIDVSNVDKAFQFKGKVSVVTFVGSDSIASHGEIYNLNEKIYKKFYGYTDFQMIALVEKGYEKNTEKIKKRLSLSTNMVKWNFIYASKAELEAIFQSFKTTGSLDDNAHSSKAFIIDKEDNLRRGKSTIKSQKDKKLFGYDMNSVAELKNDMHDDVKVVLAEYSFALKKNRNSDERRKNSISNEKN